MIDVLGMNPQLLFGVAGAIGAGVRGLLAFYKIKKEQKKVEFDKSIYTDTLVQGAAAGLAFSAGLPISFAALGITALGSAGVDTYFNKLGIKIMPTLRDMVIKDAAKPKVAAKSKPKKKPKPKPKVEEVPKV